MKMQNVPMHLNSLKIESQKFFKSSIQSCFRFLYTLHNNDNTNNSPKAKVKYSRILN